MNNLRNLRALAALAALAFSGALAAQESGGGNIEELVVTGSYLKRSAQDSPSPLSVVSSAEIEDLGAADVSEIVQSLPWQSGSQSRTPSFSGDFNADGRMNINLRNLGHGSTLPLVNGKRQVAAWFNSQGNAAVNVNALVPNIAIERLEIVKDGASALYGSDAVAGVVNFITKRDFEGFDFNYQYTTDEETGKGETHTGELIFGAQGADGGMVAAISVMNRDPITIGDRYERYGGSTASGTGQPGRVIPTVTAFTWAAHGKEPGMAVVDEDGEAAFPRDPEGKSFGQADVNCDTAAAYDGESGTLGVYPGGNVCPYDFGSFFNIQAEESQRKFNVTGHYAVSNSVETYFEFASSDSEFDRFNSLNPNAPVRNLSVMHPGNVEDAYRRGIEPVSVRVVSRMLGGTVDLIGTNYRPLPTYTDITRADQRIVLGTVWDFGLGDNAWSLDASYTATENDNGTTQVQDTLTTHMNLALRGLGGPRCNQETGTAGEGNLAYRDSKGDFSAGECYYFNPFGNSQFNREGEPYAEGESLELRNPKELYEWLLGRLTSDEEYRQRVIDLVVTGDLFQTGSGPVGLAVGFQRRRDSATVVFDAAGNTNNLDFYYGASDWKGSLTTTAYFAELAIPLGSRAELNLAARYEDFEELGEDTVDPKITAIVRATDSITVRASYSSSFRVPSVQQLFGTLTTVANETDINETLDGTNLAYRPAITTGNEALLPEEADTYNIGLSWVAEGRLEGLEVNADYYYYDYTDIITREHRSAVLQADNDALRAWGALEANKGKTRLDAFNAGIGNRDQVIRNPTDGALLRIEPDFLNANSAEVSGLDLTVSYAWNGRVGDWRLGFLAAWVREHDAEVPGAGGTVTKYDGVGEYNERNPVAGPLPEFKLNGTLSWSLNQHRLYMLVKHVDSMDYGIDIHNDPNPPADSARFWRETVRLAHGDDKADEFFTTAIDSMTTIDVHYTYELGELPFLANARVTLGAMNVTNEEPPWIPVNNAFDGTLHDPRGRVWYLRVGGSL